MFFLSANRLGEIPISSVEYFPRWRLIWRPNGGQSLILILLRPDTKDSKNSHIMSMIIWFESTVVIIYLTKENTNSKVCGQGCDAETLSNPVSCYAERASQARASVIFILKLKDAEDQIFIQKYNS